VNTIVIRQPGITDYSTTYALQKAFTSGRGPDTMDELWCLQHFAVYTLGLAGKSEHILDSGKIPIVRSDRGGQVTYHGPGQLIIYPLIDIKRRNITIRQYVSLLEQAVIDLLNEFGITGQRQDKAPGVYVDNKKIASLGIRVRGGCCYHGLSLNVDMDLAPFQGINPCGYPQLEVTQLIELGVQLSVEQASARLAPYIASGLRIENILIEDTHVENHPTILTQSEVA